MWADALLAVFLGILSALVAEGITWLMVFRTEQYKKLNRDIEKQSNRIMQLKQSGNPNIDRQLKKRITIEEGRLRRNINDEFLLHKKASLIVFIAVVALLAIVNELLDGRVVAKVPFLRTSLDWIQGVTQRNLPGNGYYDLAYVLLYLLCFAFVRYHIDSLLFKPSEAAVMERAAMILRGIA